MKKTILCVLPFENEQKNKLISTYEEANFIFTNNKDLKTEELESADVVVGNVLAKNFKYLKNKDLVQLNSAGYEAYTSDVIGENTILANAGDAYGVAVSEHLFAMFLSMAKKLPFYRDYQNTCTWTDLGQVMPIHDLNVVVIGLGAIGGAFAKNMKLLNNHIIGIKNNISVKPDFVDEVYTLDKVDELLPNADVVVLTIPATEKTIGFMSNDRFSKMKKGSLFFNVGRGALVDSVALKFALENDIIGGAGIDVTHIEPLPSDDPLWNTKNLLITPHCSGGFHMQETVEKLQAIAIKNINAYFTDKKYINKVN